MHFDRVAGEGTQDIRHRLPFLRGAKVTLSPPLSLKNHKMFAASLQYTLIYCSTVGDFLICYHEKTYVGFRKGLGIGLGLHTYLCKDWIRIGLRVQQMLGLVLGFGL